MDDIKDSGILQYLPDPYALFQVILDEKGQLQDLRFLDVNPALERMTGLPREDLLGRGVSLLKEKKKISAFSWFDTDKEGLTCAVSSFEEYLKEENRWYQVTAYPYASDNFVTIFRDITKEKEEAKSLETAMHMVQGFYEAPRGGIGYRLLLEKLSTIAQARYGVLNMCDDAKEESLIKAIFGPSLGIKKATEIFGFPLEGKRWNILSLGDKLTSRGWLVTFPNIHEAFSGSISRSTLCLLEKTLELGEVFIIEIIHEQRKIGEIIFCMQKGVSMRNKGMIEILCNQMGSAFLPLQGETSLRVSEKLFEDIFGALDDVVWSVSLPDYKPLYVSPGCQRVYGYTQREFMAKGDIWLEAVHPEDKDIVLKAQKTLFAKKKVEYEYRIRDRQNRVRWVRDKSYLMEDARGKPFRMYGILSDISKVVKAQEDLRQSEERHRTILNFMMEGCQLLDFDWRFLFTNDAAARFGEKEKKEIIGKKLTEVYPEILGTALLGHLEEVMENKIPRLIDTQLKSPKGSKWFKLSIQPVEEGLFILSLDITKEKEAEEEEMRQRGELEAFFHISLDLLGILSPTLQFLKVNQAWEEILGYKVSDLLGKNILEYVHPEDEKSSQKSLEELLQENLGQSFSNRYRCKDGSYRYLEWRASLFEGRIYAAARDLTSYYEAKERLKELNDELYERLKERTALHKIISLSEGENVHLEEILKETVRIIPEGWRDPKKTIARILFNEKEYLTGDYALASKKVESYLWVGGEVAGFLEVYYTGEDKGEDVFLHQERELLHAIAERLSRIIEGRMARDSLNENQEILNQVLNSVPQSIFWKDKDLFYLGCNHKFAQIVGLHDPEEIIGLTDFALPWPLDDAKAYRRDDWEVIASQRAKRHIIEPLQGADGRRLIIDTTKVPLFNSEGEIYAVLGVFEDITKRKKMEGDLKRSNAELEQFAYAVSHDMRQPLRMITSYIQLLEEELQELINDETKKYMYYVLDGAKRMDEMIVGLLEYSRIGRKRDPLESMQSKEALNEALSFLKPVIQETKALIKVQGEWPEIYASRNELTRLFQNLLGNALKYRIEEVQPHILVKVTKGEGVWVFSVKDNGIGIDQGESHRLFQVFSRLQSRSHFEGSGIGLALSRKIVQHHGGHIWQESEGEGRGSTFFFTLPYPSSSKGVD